MKAARMGCIMGKSLSMVVFTLSTLVLQTAKALQKGR